MQKNIVSPTSKGQITIPASIRRELGINPDTLLKFTQKGDVISITPIKIEQTNARRSYSQEEITQFIKDDQISLDDRQFFNKLLGGQ